MQTSPKISFIILTYKREAFLKKCIQSIFEQTGYTEPAELLVVDNDGGSALIPPLTNDSTLELRVELTKENLGPTGGRNYAMQKARGEYLIFVDDDAILNSSQIAHWIEQIFDQDSSCGAISGRVFKPDGEIDVFLYPYPDKNFAQKVTSVTPAPYFYEGVCAIRASVLKKAGLYPERYFYGMESWDLSIRIYNAGYQILYDPRFAIIHYEAQSGRILGENYWVRNTVNKMQMAGRLLPRKYWWTTTIAWSLKSVLETRSIKILKKIYQEWNKVRDIVREERNVISLQTLDRLKKVGARFWY